MSEEMHSGVTPLLRRQSMQHEDPLEELVMVQQCVASHGVEVDQYCQLVYQMET